MISYHFAGLVCAQGRLIMFTLSVSQKGIQVSLDRAARASRVYQRPYHSRGSQEASSRLVYMRRLQDSLIATGVKD